MPAKGPVVLTRFWSKSPSLFCYLAHARVPRPAQAEVEGEIGLDFPVVLNEGLRALQPHARQALIVRGPALDVAEQDNPRSPSPRFQYSAYRLRALLTLLACRLCLRCIVR